MMSSLESASWFLQVPRAKVNWTQIWRRETSAALKARPLVLARGVKGADSGGKLRSVRRPFNADDQLLRIYNQVRGPPKPDPLFFKDPRAGC
jgi:hypothetical protein